MTLKIMIDGDSIARGNHGDGTTNGGIMTELGALLTAAGIDYQFDMAANDGATYASRANVIHSTLVASNPDLVIMYAGINDAANGNGANVSASVAASVRAYTDSVLQFRAEPNRVKLVMGTIAITADGTRPWLNSAIGTVNYGIWKAWYDWAYSTWVPVLYNCTGMPAADLGPDHVHPNEVGYRYLAQQIYDALVVGQQIPGLPARPL